MATITEAYVDSLAPNAGAIKNGRDLVKKNSFPLLNVTEDGTLLFGECKGSGKDPYHCSVDFANEANPVFRCTCPSRQFPCKHTLGLLYASALGKAFATADIPQEIADKRDKAVKREEKNKEAVAAESSEDAKPKRKVNKSALVKKTAIQLDGLGILEKLVLQLTHSGLGSVDKKTLQMVEEQAKQLGNHYIPGAQAGLREFVMTMQEDGDREAVYTAAMEQLLAMRALTKKGRAYLEQRAENPDHPKETESTLEELLGHAWQLAELREYGRVQSDVELLQLAFMCYADQARGEFADTGWWIDLREGVIRVTRHLRPFRAAKAMREEDTFQAVVKAEELFLYPGDLGARVRWESATFREPEAADYARVKSLAQTSYPEVIKQVKNAIKNPLANKNPVLLVAYRAVERIGDNYILRDAAGKQLPLEDFEENGRPTSSLLSLLGEDELHDQAALVMFKHNLDSNRLSVQIMSIVTDSRIVRLLY